LKPESYYVNQMCDKGVTHVRNKGLFLTNTDLEEGLGVEMSINKIGYMWKQHFSCNVFETIAIDSGKEKY